MTSSESILKEGTEWISTQDCVTQGFLPLSLHRMPLLGAGPWYTSLCFLYSLFQVYGHCGLTPVGRLMTLWYSLLWARQGKDRSGAALLMGWRCKVGKLVPDWSEPSILLQSSHAKWRGSGRNRTDGLCGWSADFLLWQRGSSATYPGKGLEEINDHDFDLT